MLVAFIAVATLLMTVVAIHSWFAIKYFVRQAVTSHRVIYKEGLFLTNTDELRLDALEAVSVFQPFLEKILGCGRLEFTGRGGSPVKLIYLDNLVRVKKHWAGYQALQTKLWVRREVNAFLLTVKGGAGRHSPIG